MSRNSLAADMSPFSIATSIRSSISLLVGMGDLLKGSVQAVKLLLLGLALDRRGVDSAGWCRGGLWLGLKPSLASFDALSGYPCLLFFACNGGLNLGFRYAPVFGQLKRLGV